MEYFLEGIALLRKIFSSELQIYQSSPLKKYSKKAKRLFMS